ncbi:MAG TPA: alkaline phosphatase family protein [Candidatus Acidoferrales bacterium]|nr:alkaline phosphatase family protein [Candidatus Acidoferrales bacterium]
MIVAAVLLAAALAADAKIPRYDHIFVIVEENKDYARIIGSPDAPVITRLAKQYGSASRFYAEMHPSEPNYVAMVGGSTYGIRDDGPFFAHTIDAPNLATQLEARGLSWKAYTEGLPSPGSLATFSGYYASKHDGFLDFHSVQDDPDRAQHIVGFDRLMADLRSGELPNFSFIVPNVCNEMHGASRAAAPQSCSVYHPAALIARGDREIGMLTGAIMKSPAWRSPGNAAIVITWDEDDGGGTQGCCGAVPGGGHIPTIVITNHGPRGVVDATPYNHYSLLRTIEDAFGIHDYLVNAGATGVVPMVPLWANRS